MCMTKLMFTVYADIVKTLKNDHHSDNNRFIILTGAMYYFIFFTTYIFAATLCSVVIEDRCYIQYQWHFVRDPSDPLVR